jgi:hypothetical protein
MEILRGDNSLKSSLKSVDEIHSQGRLTIPDHQIWESYPEDSHKVLRQFKVWNVGRFDRSRISKSEGKNRSQSLIAKGVHGNVLRNSRIGSPEVRG